MPPPRRSSEEIDKEETKRRKIQKGKQALRFDNQDPNEDHFRSSELPPSSQNVMQPCTKDKGKQAVTRYDEQDPNEYHHFSSSEPPRLLNLMKHACKQPWEKMKDKILHELKGRNIKKVIERKLSVNETNPPPNHRDRFLISKDEILEEAKHYFLTDQEFAHLEKTPKDKDKPQSIQVLMLDTNLETSQMALKRWRVNLAKQDCPVYNLTQSWQNIVICNHLKEGDKVQLWSFRMPPNQLGFALLKVTDQE